MDRIFPDNMVSPDEVMAYAAQSGKIQMNLYMEWLMTERDWDSVKKVVMDKLKSDLNGQEKFF